MENDARLLKALDKLKSAFEHLEDFDFDRPDRFDEALRIMVLTVEMFVNGSQQGQIPSGTSEKIASELHEATCLFLQLAELLEGITDRSAADAAAPGLESLKKRVEEVRTRYEQLDVDTITRDEALASPSCRLEVALLLLRKSLDRIIDNDCYSSQPLDEALQNVFKEGR